MTCHQSWEEWTHIFPSLLLPRCPTDTDPEFLGLFPSWYFSGSPTCRGPWLVKEALLFGSLLGRGPGLLGCPPVLQYSLPAGIFRECPSFVLGLGPLELFLVLPVFSSVSLGNDHAPDPINSTHIWYSHLFKFDVLFYEVYAVTYRIFVLPMKSCFFLKFH